MPLNPVLFPPRLLALLLLLLFGQRCQLLLGLKMKEAPPQPLLLDMLLPLVVIIGPLGKLLCPHPGDCLLWCLPRGCLFSLHLAFTQ
jgi:hypothetical protein